MNKTFEYSSLDTIIEHNDKKTLLYKMELSDLVRGFCGALFFALPLHYTMEMWERARVISHWDIILILVVLYFANVGYIYFAGFRTKDIRKNVWFDAMESYGIGIVASAITMLLIGQITPDIPLDVVLKIIALEAVPTSFGASIAKNSFATKKKEEEPKTSHVDLRKIAGSLLGATMVAFNVAPTMEPVVIANGLQWFHLIGIVIFSIIVSYLINFTAGFAETKEDRTGLLKSKWVETLVAYIVSLVVSAVLLWMFGYLDANVSLQLALPWIVVLGYCTTLGSSAGRIIL